MTLPVKPLRALGVSGSASPHSRSRVLIERTLAQLETLGIGASLIDLIDLAADALLARRRDLVVDAAIDQAAQAGILILGTPIYRASYTGQLKAFLDLFPQDTLRGSVVGLIATGAGSSHALAIDHGLRPLVASLRGLTAAQALYVTDAQFPDKARPPAD
ncbi:MAG TPA: NAD(P)H-dependent oxidoreductase, partial [Roseiflexaceae bacterium]|nr:NAD(P)H-dependent oxidoreductase [Roseiflexaceae bacterium]